MDSRINQVQIGYSSRLFSNGLEKIIDGFDHFSVVQCVPLGDQLKDSLDNNGSPDFLILEVDHPGERDLKYIRLLTESFGSVKILLLSHLPHRNITSDLLESGIVGYILKSCSSLDLLSALTKMSEGRPYFCSDITKILLPGNDSDYTEVDSLTEREIKVLTLLVQGLTNKTVAGELNISENTVKTHRRNIQKKFGVSNLLGMIRYACREKLVDFGCMDYCISCPYVH